jgi:hypothetical protein
MKKKTIVGLIAIVAIATIAIFAGCVEKEEVTPSTPTPLAPTSTPAPSITLTPTPTPKTELSLGESAIVDDISFTVVKYEFTDSYITESNQTIHPAEGAKFLWIYVKAKNEGEIARVIPSRDWRDMQLLYKGSEIHSQEYVHEIPPMGGKRYEPGWREEIYPNVTREGWVLFEVPIYINTSQAQLHVELYAEEATWNLGS